MAQGHQASSNRRKVSGPHNNQKKQIQMTQANARAQQHQIALQLQQQQLDNPLLLKNLNSEDHSND